MKGSRPLYLLHLAVAGLATGLLGGAAAVVLLGSDLSLPSAKEVSGACANWLGSGGPGAVLGLLVVVLAAGVIFLAARSLLRQVRASRGYLRRLPLGPIAIVDGVNSRRIEVGEPLAFCAGYLRPQIYLSRGLIEALTPQELRAVASHERHHLHRRDPLRRLLARALADGLFFVPILRRSSDRYSALGELAADQAAMTAVGDRRPLAAALLKLSEREPAPSPVTGIAPERVDHLLGDPEAGRWRLPGTLAGWSAVALLVLGAILLLAGLSQPSLDWPLLLAAGCMAAMVIGPLALGATALVISRRTLRARRSQ